MAESALIARARDIFNFRRSNLVDDQTIIHFIEYCDIGKRVHTFSCVAHGHASCDTYGHAMRIWRGRVLHPPTCETKAVRLRVLRVPTRRVQRGAGSRNEALARDARSQSVCPCVAYTQPSKSQLSGDPQRHFEPRVTRRRADHEHELPCDEPPATPRPNRCIPDGKVACA